MFGCMCDLFLKCVSVLGTGKLSVPDRELTKPIFGYFDGKLSSIASILINDCPTAL